MHIHRKRGPEREEWTVSIDPRTLRKLAKEALRFFLVAVLALSLAGNELATPVPPADPGEAAPCVDGQPISLLLNLLGEGVDQPRAATHARAHGGIVPLNRRGSRLVGIEFPRFHVFGTPNAL